MRKEAWFRAKGTRSRDRRLAPGSFPSSSPFSVGPVAQCPQRKLGHISNQNLGVVQEGHVGFLQ